MWLVYIGRQALNDTCRGIGEENDNWSLSACYHSTIELHTHIARIV